jgi:methylenetetrahydrofolate dehydrogenase (NADP+) / methenyltetrahydrofolate cyclohydrolase
MSSVKEHSAVLMLGKPVADEINARLEVAVPKFIESHKLTPTLAIVQVGHSAASERYIKKKIEACAKLHMKAELKLFPDNISADDLKHEVCKLSDSRDFHGVLVQLPLPRAIEEHYTSGTNKFDIFDAIAPEKDVDGVGHDAIASLYRAHPERMIMLPGTALAVRRIMAFYNIKTEGRSAVIIGRNDITAKPMMLMLGGRMCNAAAIWIHRHVKPEDQRRLIKEADIIITAVGVASYRITKEMVKPGVVVFDVATRVDEHGKLHGDATHDVQEVASAITPVPRGVGPVTVAALTENLFRAAQFISGVGNYGYKF